MKLGVIIKLNEGGQLPDYVELRMHIAGQIYTADIEENDIDRIKSDPNVHSFSEAQPLPGVD